MDNNQPPAAPANQPQPRQNDGGRNQSRPAANNQRNNSGQRPAGQASGAPANGPRQNGNKPAGQGGGSGGKGGGRGGNRNGGRARNRNGMSQRPLIPAPGAIPVNKSTFNGTDGEQQT